MQDSHNLKATPGRYILVTSMAQAYNAKIREKVIDFIKAGNTRQKASETFNVSYNTVHLWWKRYEETGVATAPPRQPREHRKIDPEVLRAYLEANRNATLKELAALFDCAEGSISRTIKHYGIKRKNQWYKINPVLLKKYTDKHPFITDKKLAEKFGCTESAVGMARKRHGIVRKNH